MKSIKIITGIGFLFICLLILAFYRSDYVHLFGKIDTNASSAFGALLGSIIAPFALITTYYIFREQQRLIVKQNFDSTFVNLINSFYNLLETIRLGSEKPGKDSIKQFVKLFRSKYTDKIRGIEIDLTDTKKNNFGKDAYVETFNSFGEVFNQYFKYIYFVLDTIQKQRKLSDEEKSTYIKNFKIHLNDSELLLILFHSVTCGRSSTEDKNYYNMIWKTELIKDISESILLDRSNCAIFPLLLFDLYSDNEKNAIKERHIRISEKLKKIVKRIK